MTNEQLRSEFKNLIWKTATDLVYGGKVSPVQFMDFMLGSLFYRFISENLTAHCNALMADAGVENPDYSKMSDEDAGVAHEQMVNEKGFFILPSQLFVNVANRARHDEELNATLANIFKAIEGSAAGVAEAATASAKTKAAKNSPKTILLSSPTR